MKSPCSPRRNRGMVLMAMLILSSIVALVMTGIFYRHRLDIAQAHRIFTGEQAALLALSGEHWVARLLEDDAGNSEIDALTEDWAQPVPPLPVEGGLLTGCVFDLQGRFNLNSLAGYTPEQWESELGNISSSYLDTYLNLLALLELDSMDGRAAVLIDWIDSNSEPIAGGSAEDMEYQAQRPPRFAANQLMVSPDELGSLAGYSAAELWKLRPFISALPKVTPININTAPPPVLAALIPFVDDWVIEEIVLNRPFEDIQSLQSFIAETTSYLSAGEVAEQLPSDLLSVASEFFTLIADVRIGGVQIRLQSDLYRPSGGGVQVYQRSFETLPSVELDEDRAALFDLPCLAEAQSG